MPRPLCVLYSVLITGSGPRPSVSLPRLLTGRTVTRCPSRRPAFALPSAPPRSYKASFLMYKTSAKRVNLYIRNIMPTGAPLPRVASVCYACYDKDTVLTMCTYGGGGGRCPRYIVRADRRTNCGESSGGPKGITNGFSSMIQKRARLLPSRSRTAPRVADVWSVRISRTYQPRRRGVLKSRL